MLNTTEKPNRADTQKRLDLSRALSTRGGTLAVAGICALLAGLVLLVFLNRYRDTTAEEDAAATVLVAKRLIEQGSSGDVLASEQMFQSATVPRSDLKDGAIVDPSSIKGQVAVADIYPGEQLTVTRFAPTTPRSLNKLIGDDRAIAVPVDPVHGNEGEIGAGDRVDVLVGIENAESGSLIKPLMRNVLVLSAPPVAGGQGGGAAGRVVLRVPDARAGDVAYAADHGKLWLLLRPQAGARETRMPTATLERLLSQEAR